MGCIEFLIVLAMASLCFSIVPWCVGLDQLVTNTKRPQGFFKERWLGIFSTNQPICEFAAIICLHTFDGVGKTLHTMLNKQCGRIGAVFWESLQIAKPGVFNEGVLVPLCRLFLPYNTSWEQISHRSAPSGQDRTSVHRALAYISLDWAILQPLNFVFGESDPSRR